jgi:hypothetical protein
MGISLELRRFPGTFIVAAFGVVLALLLGLELGYVLKATVVTTVPGKVVDVAAQPTTPEEDRCIFVNHYKQC